MKLQSKVFLPLISLLLIAPSGANAGAWLQKQGEGEIILNYTYYNTNAKFDEDGEEFKDNGFVKNEINPYLEYGLLDELTIGTSLSFQSILSREDGTFASGEGLELSYADIFARTYLYNEDGFVVSFQPGVRIPVEENANVNPEGDKPIMELKFLTGKTFEWFDRYHFAEASFAMRPRPEPIEDMMKVEGTLGLKLEDDYLLLSQIFIEKPLSRNHKDNNPANYSSTKLQLSLAFDYWETAFLQVGTFRVIDGVNTSGGQGFLLSTWYKF